MNLWMTPITQYILGVMNFWLHLYQCVDIINCCAEAVAKLFLVQSIKTTHTCTLLQQLQCKYFHFDGLIFSMTAPIASMQIAYALIKGNSNINWKIIPTRHSAQYFLFASAPTRESCSSTSQCRLLKFKIMSSSILIITMWFFSIVLTVFSTQIYLLNKTPIGASCMSMWQALDPVFL